MGWDSNPRRTCALAVCQVRCIRPLCHPSVTALDLQWGGRILPTRKKRHAPVESEPDRLSATLMACKGPLGPLTEGTMASKFEPVMSGRTSPVAMPSASIPVAVDSNRVLRNTYWLLALSLLPTIAGAFAGMQFNFIGLFKAAPIMT